MNTIIINKVHFIFKGFGIISNGSKEHILEGLRPLVTPMGINYIVFKCIINIKCFILVHIKY